MYKIQPIRVSFAETEQPIRSQKILRAINELVGTQQGYLKERNKSKVSIVNIEIYRSVLRVSNARVFSSG